MCSTIDLKTSEYCGIAKENQGYSWFKNTALSTLKSRINKANKYYAVINMGTNDLLTTSTPSNYAKLYNELASEYPKSEIIVTSVGPIDDYNARNNPYKLTDYHVVEFNQNLKKDLNSKVKYCDVYSKIVNDFSASDGIHYSNSTYKNIYKEINNCIDKL